MMTKTLARISLAALIASTLVLIFLAGITQDGCNDVWVHALHGKIQAEMGRYPRFSDYSFITGQNIAFNRDWLPSMLLFHLLKLWNYRGLLVFKTIGILAAITFLVLWLREEKTHWPLCACAIVVFLVIAWDRFAPRGDLFNIGFFAAFLYFLARYRREQDKGIWLLVPLQFMWIQFHHLAILGVFTILTYAVENHPLSLADRIKQGFSPLFTRYNKTLLKLALVCLLVSFVNEAGWQKTFSPFSILLKLGSQREIYANVAEFKPLIFFAGGKWQAAPLWPLLRFFVPFVAVSFLLWQHRQEVSASQWLLWVVISLVTLRFRRFQGIFAALAIPMLFIYPRRLKDVDPFKVAIVTLALHLALIISIVGGWFFMWQNSVARCQPRISTILKPVGAVDFLEKNQIGGSIYSDYNNGGYIGYRLYPKGKIFIHSLCLWYSPAHFRFYSKMPFVDVNWVACRYPIDVFVLSFHLKQDELKIAKQLQENGWPLVYLDESSAVYLRPKSPVAKRLRAKKLNPDKCKLTVDRPAGFYWLGNFFASIGYYRRAKYMYREALNREIGIPNTYNNLGYACFRLRQYKAALEYFLKAVEEDPRKEFLSGLRKTLALIPYGERNSKIYVRAQEICGEK